jgi:ActR/RegA family two-component response regulator
MRNPRKRRPPLPQANKDIFILRAISQIVFSEAKVYVRYNFKLCIDASCTGGGIVEKAEERIVTPATDDALAVEEALRPGRELRSLALEDSFADFDQLRRALLKTNAYRFQLTRARTLEEARLARARESFDIAFIDYNLGVESGVRFLQELGGREGETIPILITGLPDPRVYEIALKAGALALINKTDLTPTLLETTIRSALHARAVERKFRQIIAAFAATTSSAPTMN